MESFFDEAAKDPKIVVFVGLFLVVIFTDLREVFLPGLCWIRLVQGYNMGIILSFALSLAQAAVYGSLYNVACGYGLVFDIPIEIEWTQAGSLYLVFLIVLALLFR